MMKKIQRFGAAMYTPAILFAFAGMMVGFSIVFQNETIMGSLAAEGTNWSKFWGIIASGAWTVFFQLPILFAVSLPITLANKEQARGSLEAIVTYLTFNYFINGIINAWGESFGINPNAEVGTGTGLASIAGITTLDTGMLGALLVGGIVVFLHNRFYDQRLPEMLGTFRGTPFVVMLGFSLMIPLALLTCLVWPVFQNVLLGMQGFFKESGSIGIWIYAFLQKILIPTGLHHFVYAPFVYGDAVIQGGTSVYWATHIKDFATSAKTLKEMYPIGFSLSGLSKVFGSLGIMAAFIKTSKPERRKKVIALMIPATLTAVLTGVTEPLEFTFLFIAPILFVVHAVLDATLQMIAFALGLVGDFGGGIINWVVLNWLPLGIYHYKTYIIQVVLGIIFALLYFLIFTFLIKKMNLKTPGREEGSKETKLYYKKDYQNKKAEGNKSKEYYDASAYLDLLGGKENVEAVTNCATRLRVSVKDKSLVADEENFKDAGAYGLVKQGNNMQIIVGTQVSFVREEFENILRGE